MIEKVEWNFKISAYNTAAFQLDAYDLKQNKAQQFLPLFHGFIGSDTLGSIEAMTSSNFFLQTFIQFFLSIASSLFSWYLCLWEMTKLRTAKFQPWKLTRMKLFISSHAYPGSSNLTPSHLTSSLHISSLIPICFSFLCHITQNCSYDCAFIISISLSWITT